MLRLINIDRIVSIEALMVGEGIIMSSITTVNLVHQFTMVQSVLYRFEAKII